MNRWVLLVWIVLAIGCRRDSNPPPAGGSAQCKNCHPSFYRNWTASHHGRAMQPFGPDVASQLAPHASPVRIAGAAYQALDGYIEESRGNERRRLPIAHVLGGKNVYYLLTPMDRGRLQVMPLAFDVRNRSWYDMAVSGLRPHGGSGSEPLAWTDSAFTFNTSCYGCHVSRIDTNYDAAADAYHTTWTEPGINCESCHGDARAHAALMTGATSKPSDLKIVRTAGMTPAQRNDMCAPCHAKMSPLSSGFQPLQRFFDHYDLITEEHSDFAADGRETGETYTYTRWLRSSCATAGQLDCLHCHASTGKFRFTANPDAACLPCHQATAGKGVAHTRHQPTSEGARCIGCHMPQSRFANMVRHDHSMLPPTPETSRRHQSPNACNQCHGDRDAAWADSKVREWYRPGYQRDAVALASLMESVRKRQWPAGVLNALREPANANPVIQASLIRSLAAWGDARKAPALTAKLADAHPLVRAAAAGGLAEFVADETVRAALMRAASDEYRLVRIRAAASLASVRSNDEPLRKAVAELETSHRARPDDFTSLTNLGNFHLRRDDATRAIEAFERAVRLRPDSVGTLVNASLAYSRAGRTADAERVLRQALQRAPRNPAANFNLGLLLAETRREAEARTALRTALEADPNMAPAAFNLAILVSRGNVREAIALSRRAVAGAPDEPKYTTALAQFLLRASQTSEAVSILEAFIRKQPRSTEPYALLAAVHERASRRAAAAAVYRAGSSNPNLPPPVRDALAAKAASITSTGSSATPPASGR